MYTRYSGGQGGCGAMDSGRAVSCVKSQLSIGVLALVLVSLVSSGPAQAAPRMELLTALGYQDRLGSLCALIGATLKKTGKNYDVGLHLSSVLTPKAEESLVSIGLEGELWRVQPLSYYASVKGSAFLQQQADNLGRRFSLEAQGMFGSMKGNVTLGYVERRMATFPWENEDVINGIVEGKPYIYLQTTMAANVAHDWGLKWSQDATFRRHVGGAGYRLGISTGPEIRLGPGSLTTQGGFILGADRVRPMAQVRFAVRDPFEGKTELSLSAATTSLGRDVPLYQGWYSLDQDTWRFQALLRLEHPIDGKPAPTVYVAIQPKF
jgi:hypothetical protein